MSFSIFPVQDVRTAQCISGYKDVESWWPFQNSYFPSTCRFFYPPNRVEKCSMIEFYGGKQFGKLLWKKFAYLLSLILVELLFSGNPGKPVCMPKDMWQMSLRILSVLGSEVEKRASALNKCWDLCQRNYTTFQTSTETLDLSALEELDQSSVKYFE